MDVSGCLHVEYAIRHFLYIYIPLELQLLNRGLYGQDKKSSCLKKQKVADFKKLQTKMNHRGEVGPVGISKGKKKKITVNGNTLSVEKMSN